MPLSITRQYLSPHVSVPLSEAENQQVRSRPLRHYDGYDDAVAALKGRDPMRPVHLVGRRGVFVPPPSGWHLLPARTGDIAKVAGYNRDLLSGQATVTGTSKPDQICAASGLGVCTGMVLGGTAGPGSTGPSRVRALHAMPGSYAAPGQLLMALRVMRQDGLYVEAALAGGTRGDEPSEAMNAQVRQILADEGVPLRFDDSLPDRSQGTVDSTVAAVVLPDGSIRFGNHVEVS